MPFLRPTTVLACAAAALALLGGCGKGEEPAPKPAGGMKVGLVTDTAGVNDRSFNSLAVAGLRRAERQLGVDGTILVSKSAADYEPNLERLAREEYDLVIAVGYLIAEATDKVAARYPDTRFAIVDYPVSGLRDRGQNIQGMLFDEETAGYLAGYLAGQVATGRKFPAVSAVGGEMIPPVERYIGGYRAGVQAVNPGVKVIVDYSNSFTDKKICRKIAIRQVNEGSKIIFQLAGLCGLGALEAAQAAGSYGIGADADQSYLGEFILTSALKKVDNAVFDTIEVADEGEFLGGSDLEFGLFNQGVGLGRFGPAAAPYRTQLRELQRELTVGEPGATGRSGG